MERDREREIYYKELDHLVMEAEKSQELQSASWRCRRAKGVQSKSKGLGTRRVSGISSTLNPSPKAGENQCSSQAEKANSPSFSLLF